MQLASKSDYFNFLQLPLLPHGCFAQKGFLTVRLHRAQDHSEITFQTGRSWLLSKLHKMLTEYWKSHLFQSVWIICRTTEKTLQGKNCGFLKKLGLEEQTWFWLEKIFLWMEALLEFLLLSAWEMINASYLQQCNRH